jgi:hypothetical protein
MFVNIKITRVSEQNRYNRALKRHARREKTMKTRRTSPALCGTGKLLATAAGTPIVKQAKMSFQNSPQRHRRHGENFEGEPMSALMLNENNCLLVHLLSFLFPVFLSVSPRLCG